MVLLLAAWSAGIAVAEPPVEGDRSLINLVLDAQRANLPTVASSGQGEIKIERTYRDGNSKGHKTTNVLNLRQVWSGKLVFWEYDCKSKVNNDRVQPGPTYIRMLFDGSVYILYRPLESGGVTIFDPQDFHNCVPWYGDVEERPSIRWSKCVGLRPWEELLGPHPNFPQEGVQKWVIHQEGSRVVTERYDVDKDGKRTGKRVDVASLDLAGHIVESRYDGGEQQHRYEYAWRKDDNARLLMERERRRSDYHDGFWKEEDLRILSFDPTPTTSLSELGFPEMSDVERKGLRIRKGTLVEDRIRKKRYTYGGPIVTEEMLKRLGEAIRSRGLAKPPGEAQDRQ